MNRNDAGTVILRVILGLTFFIHVLLPPFLFFPLRTKELIT